MKDVARFSGLMKRGDWYSLRTHVPVGLARAYGRREVVTALRTTDYGEAVRRAKLRAAELEQQFASLRAADLGSNPNAVATTLTLQQRRQLADRYYLQRVDDEPLNRYSLLKRARADQTAFWRGDIVPAPDDEHIFRRRPHSFWVEHCSNGETPLEDAFL